MQKFLSDGGFFVYTTNTDGSNCSRLPMGVMIFYTMISYFSRFKSFAPSPTAKKEMPVSFAPE